MNVWNSRIKRQRKTEGDDDDGKCAIPGKTLDSNFKMNLATSSSSSSCRNRAGINGNRTARISSTNSTSNKRFRRFAERSMSSKSRASSVTRTSAAKSASRSWKTFQSSRRISSNRSSSCSTRRGDKNQPFASEVSTHIVCAVSENLARETCVASMDAGTPVCLQVIKQGNGQTYAETIACLEILQPHEVLLNEGRRNSPLARKILQLYNMNHSQEIIPERQCNEDSTPPLRESCSTSTVVKFISRGCFDQTKGAAMLRQVARKEAYDATVLEEYILLSSSHAVLQYTQSTLGVSFSKHCLDIALSSGGKNQLSIDRSTLLQLEVLTNAKTGKTKHSVLSSIDCTKTTVGSRLLRTTLMAPPCRVDTINARLDLVDSFLQDEDFFYAVMGHLQKLPAVDKMLTNVSMIPRKNWKTKQDKEAAPGEIAKLASKGISALVCVKTTLSALPSLSGALHDHLNQLQSRSKPITEDDDNTAKCPVDKASLLMGLGGGPPSTRAPRRHQLLRAILQALSQPELSQVCKVVSGIFTESTSFSRNTDAMRHQQCFALKSEGNGMMDILRKTFLANVDDIYRKADEYAEIYGIQVAVRYSAVRGYYLAIHANQASNLPSMFIKPAKSSNYIHCTTEEVQSLNIRAQDNVQDLLLMTNERINAILEEARSKYDAMAALSDAIALLDLCHSFADKVTLSKKSWSRPIISAESKTSNASLVIRNGRYEIDAGDVGQMPSEGCSGMISNDAYATGGKKFTVVTGINGSGKSTYLKQIAIIVLLGHCGSYVPAEKASLPLRRRLFARMGTADDQENNISSFMLEMKEMAFICNHASSDSLILLDELGRATSNEDGIAIAWSIAEYLLKTRSMVWFVTHFSQVSQLSDIYPTVQNLHLKASVDGPSAGGIQYFHKVTPGPCQVSSNYGVEMAHSCGWPEEVVEDARRLESIFQGKLRHNCICTERGAAQESEVMKNSKSKIEMKTVVSKVVQVVQSAPSIDSLRAQLQAIRISFSLASAQSSARMVANIEVPKTTDIIENHTAEKRENDPIKKSQAKLSFLAQKEACHIDTKPKDLSSVIQTGTQSDYSSVSSLGSSMSDSSSYES